MCFHCPPPHFSQVPDGATVALVPRHSKHVHHDNHDYVAGESEYTQQQLSRA